jgi:single-stranded DNA-binding protein
MIGRFQLIGNVGSVEVSTYGDRKLARLSIFCNDGYYGKDEQWVEQTFVYNVQVWSPVAKEHYLFQKVTKRDYTGDLVVVEGDMKPDSKGDGDDRKFYMNLDLTDLKVLRRAERNKSDA